MARPNAQELIEQLEAEITRLNQYDRRRVVEWRSRLDDDDIFDRQDVQDMREMVDSL